MRFLAVSFLFLGTLQATPELLWDYGPERGTKSSWDWASWAEGQNFADSVTFTSAVSLSEYHHFSTIDWGARSLRVKVLADAEGAPGELLHSVDVHDAAPSAYLNVMRRILAFEPLHLQAGTYWIGAAGISQEAGQMMVSSPGDGRAAQFSGTAFAFMNSAGDQAFRLYGDASPVPEPSAIVLAGTGVALIFVSRGLRRRSR